MHKIWMAAGALAAASSAPAHAAVTISFTGGNSATNGTDGNVLEFSSDGVGVQASGWTVNPNSGRVNSSWLGRYGNGLGVTGDSESGFNLFNQYGVDNAGNGVDFVLLIFNQPVSLNSAVLSPIQSSLFSNDNDLTIAYATLANAFAGPISDYDSNSPLWSMLAGTANTYSGNGSSPFINAASSGNFANIWMISAAISNPDFYSDGFHLSSVTVSGWPSSAATTAPAVPEPSTWGMMLLGFATVGLSLRKKDRSKNHVLRQIA